MSIVRTPNRKRYTSVSSDLAENPELSFSARGLALYLLAKPTDWIITIADLQRKGGTTKAKLRSSIIELEKAGYMVFYRTSKGRGGLKSFWQMYETPVDTGERSASYQNRAIAIFTSPENTPDVNTSDVKRGDIVNTHVVNTQLPKTQLGEESPITPLYPGSAGEGNSGIVLPFTSGPTSPPSVRETSTPATMPASDVFALSPPATPLPAPKTQNRRQSAQISGRPAPGNAPDLRAKHPAIAALREIAERYPAKVLWDKLIETIGDSPDTDLLKTCFLEHIERGLNRNSWKWATDWYVAGGPKQPLNQAKTRTYAKQAEGLSRYEKIVERERLNAISGNGAK